jgi:prevent-host-death family protein
MKPTTQIIPAGEFKAKCLGIMDQVNSQHKAVIITKHGKPIVKLVPYEEQASSLFGSMQNTIKIKGDIVETLGEQWDADED